MSINNSQDTGLLRLKQVLELIPVSRATFVKGVRDGRFPKPIRNGRCVFWRSQDVREFIKRM